MARNTRKHARAEAPGLFAETGTVQLSVLGSQGDIRYHGSPARGILNPPASTGMGFWSINPYVGCAFGCAYCYARYTHRYAMERAAALPSSDRNLKWDAAVMPPWLAFERRILVKENAAEALRRDLRAHAGKLQGETIVIGTATDPYQPAERRYRITRGLLEVLLEWRGPDLVIITKSPLVTRDIDLLQKLAAQGRMSVHVTIITLDPALARRIETRAPTPQARLGAVRKLSRAGIHASVNIMPVLPGITDALEDMESLVKQAAEAGARSVAACALRLQRTARERYLPLIDQEFPGLAARYRKTYARSHEVSAGYRRELQVTMKALSAKYGIERRARDSGPAGAGMEQDTAAPRPADSVQLEIFNRT